MELRARLGESCGGEGSKGAGRLRVDIVWAVL